MKTENSRIAKMSPAQQNIYHLALAYPESSVTNIGGLMWLPDDIEEEKLLQCTSKILASNGSFHMRLSRKGYWYYMEQVDMVLPIETIEGNDLRELEEQIQSWMDIPFELYNQPLHDVRLVRWNGKHAIFGRFHHLISDAVDICLHLGQYEEWYQNPQKEIVRDDSYFEMLVNREWYSEQRVERAKKYYHKLFDGVTNSWKLQEGSQNLQAARYIVDLPEALNDKLYTFAVNNGLSVESVVYALLALYISYPSGQPRAAIGRVMLNRSKKTMNTMGLFANTLPVLIEWEQGESFLTICHDVKAKLFEMMRYSEYGCDELIQELGRTDGIFDLSVSYYTERILPIMQWGFGEKIYASCLELPMRIEVLDQEDGITLQIQYQTACYKLNEIQAMVSNLFGLTDQALDGIPIEELTYIHDETSRRLQTKPFNMPSKEYPLISDCFWQQVQNNPDAIAWMESGACVIRYQEAGRIVRTIRAALRRSGVEKGLVVALSLARTHYLPASMLAVLSLGAIFFPIAYCENEERRKQLTEGCFLVTDAWVREVLTQQQTEGFEEDRYVHVTSQDAAYQIMTSGSTGRPKRVRISQGALSLRLHWMKEDIGGGMDRILQKTVNVFDVSIWELLYPVIDGKSLYMMPDGEEKMPDQIATVIQEQEITCLHFVPSMLAVFLNYIENKRLFFPSVKQVIVSGEACSTALCDAFYASFPQAVLHNYYGPAECTIDVSSHRCEAGEAYVPLGQPAYGTKLLVMNPSGKPLGIGMTGELWIVGALVGMGYENQKELTEQRFVTWENQPAYRTGDLVKIAAGGELVYVGRANREMKLRGMRIDEGEIEHVMLSHDSVMQAAVTIYENQLLAAYAASEQVLDWREYLVERLPAYAIPDEFHWFHETPFTANGKLDREGWFQQVLARRCLNIEEALEQRDEWEEPVHQVITSFVNHSIQRDDNLLHAGLDSLSVIQVLIALEQIGFRISFQEFYTNPTIAGMVKAFREKEDSHTKGFVLWEPKKLQRERKLMLCIPYAGGEVSLLEPLARELSDVGYRVVVLDWNTYRGHTLKQVASQLVEELPDYDTIEIIGCCVGAALALELASRDWKGKLQTLYLCAALPLVPNRKGKIIWDYGNRHLASAALSVLRGRRLRLTSQELQNLRTDVRVSAAYYQRQEKLEISCPIVGFYGTRDILTFGFRKKVKRFRPYLDNKMELEIVHGGRHFMTISHAVLIAKRIAHRNEG